jgi:hypothetical protein
MTIDVDDISTVNKLYYDPSQPPWSQRKLGAAALNKGHPAGIIGK